MNSDKSTISSVSNSASWITIAGLAALPAVAFLASYISNTDTLEAENANDKIEDYSDARLRQLLQRSMHDGPNVGEGDTRKAPIYRIVLTGGPCGGKSTSLSMISDRLRSLGFRVFVVPEAATIIITGGGIWKDYKEMTPDQALAFEGNLMKTKIALEDAFYGLAEASGEPSVIICDRGTMDTAAYLPKESWEVLLDNFGWNVMTLRDRRYDAVFHLVTAAIGAEKYYTTENNTARTETVEEARILDFKILNSWVGHPYIHIIDNSTDFQDKIKRVTTGVCQFIGAPKPVNFKRKFLIKNVDSIDIPVKYEQFEVEQTYLVKGKGENAHGFTFIRRRGQNGSYHYSYSVLRDAPDITENEPREKTVLERQISGREYIALMKQADSNRVTVKKRVRVFVYNNQYFQLSTFLEPSNGVTVLETETSNPNQVVRLPSWLSADREVTDDLSYTSFKIAKKKKQKMPTAPSHE